VGAAPATCLIEDQKNGAIKDSRACFFSPVFSPVSPRRLLQSQFSAVFFNGFIRNSEIFGNLARRFFPEQLFQDLTGRLNNFAERGEGGFDLEGLSFSGAWGGNSTGEFLA
jgi:hypothetical protein